MQTANRNRQFNFRVPDFAPKNSFTCTIKAFGQPVDTENCIVTAEDTDSYAGIV